MVSSIQWCSMNVTEPSTSPHTAHIYMALHSHTTHHTHTCTCTCTCVYRAFPHPPTLSPWKPWEADLLERHQRCTA